MVRKSSRAYYTGISMPKELMDEVELFIKKHPELQYRTRAEFCKAALREKMDRDYKLKDRAIDLTQKEIAQVRQMIKSVSKQPSAKKT